MSLYFSTRHCINRTFQDILGGNIGLAVTQVISMIGMCNWGLRQTAELENQMTSVERVVEYINQKPEPEMSNKGVDNLWPSRGEIKFIDLSVSYAISSDDGDEANESSNLEFILKNLNFSINSKVNN